MPNNEQRQHRKINDKSKSFSHYHQHLTNGRSLALFGGKNLVVLIRQKQFLLNWSEQHRLHYIKMVRKDEEDMKFHLS
jgi:hypothetical protein